MWIAAVRPGRRSSELCAKSTIRVGGMRGVMLAVVLSIAAIAGAQGQDVGHAPTGTAVSDSSRGHGPMFWAIQPGAGRRIDAASAPVLQRRISLTLTEVPLGLAVQQIAARARVDVTFSTELIPTGARASIAADDVTVAAALTRVLAHMKTDVLLGEEGQLTLIPQADARIAVDSSGALTGTLIDAEQRPARALRHGDPARHRPSDLCGRKRRLPVAAAYAGHLCGARPSDRLRAAGYDSSCRRDPGGDNPDASFNPYSGHSRSRDG